MKIYIYLILSYLFLPILCKNIHNTKCKFKTDIDSINKINYIFNMKDKNNNKYHMYK